MTEAATIDPEACPCGSGLRAIRCCGQDISLKRLPAAAARLKPQAEEAQKAWNEGRGEEAARLAIDILELAPGHPEAMKVLYEARKAANHPSALVLLRRLVALYPNDFAATNELALQLLARGAVAEAETHARNAVRIAPENAQAHHLMGMVMTEMNRPQVGEYHYRKALALAAAREPMLLANLALNLKNQGKMAEARALYQEARKAAPKMLHAVLGWARLEEADRDFDAASKLLGEAEALAPGNPTIALSRAVVHSRRRAWDEALAQLEAMAAGRDGGGLGPAELLEKGRLLDRLGRYDEAFAAFEAGKARLREVTGVSYGAAEAEDLVRRLKSFFTAERMRITPRAGVRTDCPQPVFIVGFPRSGTTLVEQTLSAHPAIAAADELPFIHDIAGLAQRMLGSPLSYPDALCELWMGDQREALDNLRDYYLQRARQFGVMEEGARWFTDKMPLNETHLGLIALLFPASPILHVVRHPMDVALSVFSNLLTHGFCCAYALETTARHYALIADLVAHYRGVLTMRYLPVRYEDVVERQEAEVRRMLTFIGEPFDLQCLAFEKNRRYARTASYAQVTESLYDRSAYRFRHYLEHLRPIEPILAPAMRRLGYAFEALDKAA
ncbi:MAG TPA: sulfotransferase [Caulobacteraceae bacterium]|nr:sulfotransferase [Caulobacteraceae bacterium]